jgi:hypothetical protein
MRLVICNNCIIENNSVKSEWSEISSKQPDSVITGLIRPDNKKQEALDFSRASALHWAALDFLLVPKTGCGTNSVNTTSYPILAMFCRPKCWPL